jgi:hypothetical protein
MAVFTGNVLEGVFRGCSIHRSHENSKAFLPRKPRKARKQKLTLGACPFGGDACYFWPRTPRKNTEASCPNIQMAETRIEVLTARYSGFVSCCLVAFVARFSVVSVAGRR